MTPAALGRYRIDGEVGRGGMGVVYRAHDPELDREVAVKLIALPPDASRELRNELETRFRREAKAAARIRHPGVVAIHDVGVNEHGLFLVMELVAGESLQHRIERGAFPDRAGAVELAARAADALAAAHDAGVVHRDVKPANILLAPDPFGQQVGRVMLTDFGVARSLDEVSDLTRTGMVVGSPAYMAPEQLQGAGVDGRADLFSLGVVLYELLLHKRPFPARSITTLLYQILHEDPLADPAIVRELDPATAEVLRRLLAKRPEERFPDARSAAATLRGLPIAAVGGEAPTQPRFAPPPLPPAGPGSPGTTMPTRATVAMPPPAPPMYPVQTQVPGRPPRLLVPLLVLGGLVAVAALAGVVALVWSNAQPAQPPVVQAQPTSAWSPGSAPLPEGSLAVTVVTPVPPPVTALAPMPTAGPPAEPVPGATIAVTMPAEPAPTTRPLPVPTVEAPSRPQPQAEPLVIRLACRKGVEWDVDPDETEVWIDGKDMGQVHTLDDVDFDAPGWHTIQLVLPGYRPVTVQVDHTPDADDRRAEVKVDMQKLDEH